MKLLDIGYVASIALFFAFCGLSIIGSKGDLKVSELGTESIAPENLRSAAESFRLKLAVEKNSQITTELSDAEPQKMLEAIEKKSKALDEMSKSESWGWLEEKLSAYATRIELLSEQRRFMNSLTHWAGLISALSMLAFSVARGRCRRSEIKQGHAEGPTGTAKS